MKSTPIVQNVILQETASHICSVMGKNLEKLIVERVVIGLFFTGVKLSNGFGGLCFTPIKSIPKAVCCPSMAHDMPDSGKLCGKEISTFIEQMLTGNQLHITIGIAVLNALSAAIWAAKPPTDYRIATGSDTLETVEIADDANVVVVGALAPIIKRLIKRDSPFTILEYDPLTLRPDEMPYYAPADKAHEHVPKADLLVITGTTLINNTLDGLLTMAKPGADIVIVGPTASMLPDAFFRRGVRTLGGVIVDDPDRVLNVIAEAGSGYHFFGKGADRVSIELTNTQRDWRVK